MRAETSTMVLLLAATALMWAHQAEAAATCSANSITLGNYGGSASVAGQIFTRAVAKSVKMSGGCHEVTCQVQACLDGVGCLHPITATISNSARLLGARVFDVPKGYSFKNYLKWTILGCHCCGGTYEIVWQASSNFYGLTHVDLSYYNINYIDGLPQSPEARPKLIGGFGGGGGSNYAGSWSCTLTTKGTCA